MMRVDGDADAHAGAQSRGVLVLVEGDAYGHALHDLDPVPARVLRRQDRELRAGARADGQHATGEGVVRERVDVERRRLADAQVGKVGLLRIGIDPRLLVIDDAQHRRARADKTTELDVVHLRRSAGDRRTDNRIRQVTLRIFYRALRLHVFGEFFKRKARI